MSSTLEPKSKKQKEKATEGDGWWNKMAKKGWLGDRARITATTQSDEQKRKKD